MARPPSLFAPQYFLRLWIIVKTGCSQTREVKRTKEGREGKMSGESWEWEGRVKEAAAVAEQGKVLGGLPALLPPLPGEEEVLYVKHD